MADPRAELRKKIEESQAKRGTAKTTVSSAEARADLIAKIEAAQGGVAQPKEQKPGAVLGLLGAVGSALSGPQQAAFKNVRGLRQIATGDLGGGIKSMVGGIAELATQGQAGGKDIEFTDVVGAERLPYGVETAAQLALDPLNFVTLGAGAAAKQGIKTAVKELGEEAAQRLVQQGLRKGLSEAEQSAVRQALVRDATEAGAKNAERTAGRVMKALDQRARGGVTVRLGGMSATPLSGARAAEIGQATGLTAARNAVTSSAPVRGLRRAIVPGAAVADVVGQGAADQVLAAQTSRLAREQGAVSDLTLRLKSAVDDFEGATGKKLTADDDTFVSRALESGDLDAAIATRPDLERVIRTADAVRNSTGDAQVAAGVLRESGLRDAATYLHRELTEGAAKALDKAPVRGGTAGGSVGSSLRQGAAKARVVAPDSTQEEINRAIDLIQRGEQVPDGLLRDDALVARLQETLQRRLDEIGDEIDEIRSRNLEGPRQGTLTRAQERKLAADQERLRRLEAQIKQELRRVDQVDNAATRAGAAVEQAGERRIGNIVGRGREQVEQARQLGAGDASRGRQLALRARRREKLAARTDDELANRQRSAVEGVVRPTATRARTFDAAAARAGVAQDAADEARAAADAVKGVRRPRTQREINRELNRQAGKAEAVTSAERRTTQRLTGGEARRQEGALARALRERDAAADATADRAARYKEEAGRRVVRQDQRRLQELDRQAQRVTERMAEKSKEAEDQILDLAHSIAQALPPGEKLYNESAMNSLLTRGQEAHKAIATAEYVNDLRTITDDTGEKILLSADDVAAGADVPSGWVSFELPKLGKFHAPAAVKAEITKFHAIIGADDAVSSFADFLRRADKWWKTMVTVHPAGVIPFGLRNARSNAFLTFADGMSPRWFGRGLEFQRRVNRIKKDFAADIADLGVEEVLKRELKGDYALYDAAVQHGVIGSGYFDIDLADTPKLRVKGAPKQGSRGRRATRAALGTEGGAAAAGRRFNSAIEQNARLSHFLYSVDRLGNLKDAAERTNTVLFDYGRVTPFEQRVIKRVIPFWTFASRVVPAQFRAIIENPARVIVPEKISRLTTDPVGEDAPEYQRRLGARISKFGPAAGMVTIPERPFQAAVKSLEPLSQLAAATIPGRQGPLEPEQGMHQAFRSIISQAGGAPGAQLKAVAEDAGNVDLFTGFRLANNETRQRLLAEAIPPLGRLPRFAAEKLPDSVVEKRRQKGQPLLADIAALLGIKLEQQTRAQRR